jgi:Flp pilus assembly protein TadD
VAAFERALSATEPTVELLNALGNAQLRAGRAAEAAKTLEQSLVLNPDQPEIRTLLETARRAPGSTDPSDSRSPVASGPH